MEIRDKTEALIFGLIAAVCLVVGVNHANGVLDQPDVHVSSQTGECVRVINYAESDDYNCYEMPNRYNKVWVLE